MAVVKKIHDTLDQKKKECYMWRILWCFTPPDTGQLLVELLHQGLGVRELGLQRALPPGRAAEEQMGRQFFGRGQQRHHQRGSLINHTAEARTPLGLSGEKAKGTGTKKCNVSIVLYIQTPTFYWLNRVENSEHTHLIIFIIPKISL